MNTSKHVWIVYDCFFLSTELETLRARVATLERDVSGLEAIVKNLDHQVFQLYNDAVQHRLFVLPNGPPEDELVTCCVFV